MAKELEICTFDCNDIQRVGRTLTQVRRSPVSLQPGQTPTNTRDSRESTKYGVVISPVIPALRTNEQCCPFNPGTGLVRVLDRRGLASIPSSCPTPPNGEKCWAPRPTNRCPYRVYNWSCRPLIAGQLVKLWRDYQSSFWQAELVDAQAHLRVRLITDYLPPTCDATHKCRGPIDVEVMDYVVDPQANTCILDTCKDAQGAAVRTQVWSDLCCTIPAGTELEATPYTGCDGCAKLWLKDTRPRVIRGTADIAIPGFNTTTNCEGKALLPISDVDANGCWTPTNPLRRQEVFNMCGEIPAGTRVLAELHDCRYDARIACCPT